MLGPDTPTTFTPRPGSKGFPMDNLESFFHMQQFGIDFVEAAIACFGGHKMTPELAALCITTYWRRYVAVANYQESRGAAITMQAAVRGFSDRVSARHANEAAREMQLQTMFHSRGSGRAEEPPQDDYLLYDSAAKLQAIWRGHLARAFVDKLRWQSKSKLQRTFSWSKKGKKKPGTPGAKNHDDAIKTRSAKDILAGAGIDAVKSGANAIKRSKSFDRFSRGVKSIGAAASAFGSSSEKDTPPPPTKSKQLLFILLQRGPNGLGLELDATNTVVNMVPGGAAATQGYFQEGDTIASVDGIPLRGRLLQDVMDRHKNSYSFDVWRLTPVEPDPPKKSEFKPVRRAFSFDRKKR